ncbi:MAG: hypothetical protein HY015_08955 [Bacteroidetes bacterium]|nr:hypothetical protein [Bacteroidota bacterium]
MKSRIINIVSSAFLIGTLLFAQIGVNFFHRNHDVHENKSVTAPLKGGTAGVQKHDEHCKVCSIDFFNHAFISTILVFAVSLFPSDYKEQLSVSAEHNFISFAHGRAPPVSLS